MNRTSLRHWIGLGLANGILVGGALAAAHRGHALTVAAVAGAFITSTYLLCWWWRLNAGK